MQVASRILRALPREPGALCASESEECASRAACELDEHQLSRARAGSRADFDAFFERAFVLLYRAARRRLPSCELAEATTRALLTEALAAPELPSGCVTARLLRKIQQIAPSGLAP